MDALAGSGGVPLVVAQDVLGGLRVRMLKWPASASLHGFIALQTFLVLVCAMALFLSRWWINSEKENKSRSAWTAAATFSGSRF